jgi:hypothetical protein
MLSKPRLNKIRDDINDDGIFPTSIVINLVKGLVSFETAHQEDPGSLDVGKL